MHSTLGQANLQFGYSQRRNMDRETEIRQIAYQLWEKEGRPQGRDLEHYFKAEAIYKQRHGAVASRSRPGMRTQTMEDDSE